MKIVTIKFSAILIISALVFGGCNKTKDKITPDDSGTQSTSALDQSTLVKESDQALEDASTVVSYSSNNGRLSGGTVISGATIDSATAGTYVITYNGTSADGLRYRTGKITVKVGPTATSKWNAAGTTLTLTFADFKVTKISTGKSITFNGTKVVKNEGSYDWRTLTGAAVNSQIIHRIRSKNMSVLFDNGTSRSWSIARYKVITKTSNYNYSVTISGDTSIGNYTNNYVETWGENRLGQNFVNEITTPIVFASSCNYTGTQGVLVHHFNTDSTTTKDLTLTYGVNSNGSTHTSTGCPYGYKFNWIGLDGTQKQIVLSY